MWQQEFSILTTAEPQAIWARFVDVAGWPQWNAGVERIVLDGPFADGTTFEMKTPAQDVYTSRLRAVREGSGFEDETVLGAISVRVDHRIEPLAPGRTRITYAAQVDGPDAEAIGAAVTEDFPVVLASLAALVERDGHAAR